MDVKTAKTILEHETQEPSTNNQQPLAYKYSWIKIIDYLWASYLEGEDRYTRIDWLVNLYKEVGMLEEEVKNFSCEIERMSEVIERNPLKNIK